ncbi:MAG: diacylglycerol kinase family lipid kinase [Bacteroidales bacterium]|nr:diacylglycerol kinase family lipid kinase [Bacteroidales bacterium]
MQKKKIMFIVNPRAGIGYYKKVVRLVKKQLDLNVYEYQLQQTHYRGHGQVLASQAANNGIDIVVAVGGDGTINEIAGALVGKNVVLGLIPTGSGNGLAHHLQIPTGISKAIKVINRGNISEIDTIDINGKKCISIAGLGFDGLVAELFDRSSRRGFFPYLYHVMSSFRSYKPQTYYVEEKGKEKQEHTVMLVGIANSSQWGFNLKMSPKASMDDGRADICLMKKPDFFTLPFSTTALLTGNVHKDKWNMHICCVSECTIYTKDNIPQPFHIDGDPVERQTKLDIKVCPKSLRIITPEYISNKHKK